MSNPLALVWIYNDVTGAVEEWPWAMAKAAIATWSAWHGPFPTKQDALNFYTANASIHTNWKAPTGLAGNVVNAATGPVGAVASSVASPVIAALQQWFQPAVEVAVGVVLLAVAANAILKETTGVNVAQKTGKVVKAGAKTAAVAAV